MIYNHFKGCALDNNKIVIDEYLPIMPTIMPQIAKQILSETDAGIKDISEDARDVSDVPTIPTKIIITYIVTFS